jgi:hypothetical protein
MFRSESGSRSGPWCAGSDDDRRGALVQCAVARSVLSAARGAGVPLDPTCEESLSVIERWCEGDATAAEVRTATREVTLRRLEVDEARDAAGRWRRRMCDEVLRACNAAREAFDGNPLERTSKMSMV